METNFEKIGKILKISLNGRLVALCSEEFKQTMTEAIENNKWIVLDLSAMSYIDSSGLGALVFAQQQISAKGGDMKLACLQPKPRIVFDITKVYRIFEIYDSVDAAIAAFNPEE